MAMEFLDFLEVGTEAMVTTQPTDFSLYDEGDSVG